MSSLTSIISPVSTPPIRCSNHLRRQSAPGPNVRGPYIAEYTSPNLHSLGYAPSQIADASPPFAPSLMGRVNFLDLKKPSAPNFSIDDDEFQSEGSEDEEIVKAFEALSCTPNPNTSLQSQQSAEESTAILAPIIVTAEQGSGEDNSPALSAIKAWEPFNLNYAPATKISKLHRRSDEDNDRVISPIVATAKKTRFVAQT